jgi:catechol 2,3-dioxygenase-like lactoylglutathione lyase family enzyme
VFQVIGLDHVALTVRDPKRSSEWYQRVLGMEQRYQDVWSGPHDPIMVCSGETCLALFPPDTTNPLPPPDHNVIAMRHFALRLDRRDFERAQVELAEQNIPFSFEDHTIAHSIYVFDPDGHRVELTTYELA